MSRRAGLAGVGSGGGEAEAASGFQVREVGPADYEAVRACIDEVYRETGAHKTQVFDRALWEWQYFRTNCLR